MTNIMTNIAMENPQTKWRYECRNIIYLYGPFIFHGYVSHNQRVP